ncbi:uncharacterized protein LOC102357999 isoform X2 [Latimeria chalumnae]|uniref:uncharacterized protein LOC102357999 isoform X2 n=1 Tax=Latimeria chalumnae TaxID=7897 RepID=UPI0006D8E6CA|nr:PREDICTED: uncharacterized protein LOC102357999 [Latimeria chalumnae]|eukprot:XP_014349859.1 PREDICTED: uncharacterized protein LOC102357999 [Latimeria chalumnae]
MMGEQCSVTLGKNKEDESTFDTVISSVCEAGGGGHATPYSVRIHHDIPKSVGDDKLQNSPATAVAVPEANAEKISAKDSKCNWSDLRPKNSIEERHIIDVSVEDHACPKDSTQAENETTTTGAVTETSRNSLKEGILTENMNSLEVSKKDILTEISQGTSDLQQLTSGSLSVDKTQEDIGLFAERKGEGNLLYSTNATELSISKMDNISTIQSSLKQTLISVDTYALNSKDDLSEEQIQNESAYLRLLENRDTNSAEGKERGLNPKSVIETFFETCTKNVETTVDFDAVVSSRASEELETVFENPEISNRSCGIAGIVTENCISYEVLNGDMNSTRDCELANNNHGQSAEHREVAMESGPATSGKMLPLDEISTQKQEEHVRSICKQTEQKDVGVKECQAKVFNNFVSANKEETQETEDSLTVSYLELAKDMHLNSLTNVNNTDHLGSASTVTETTLTWCDKDMTNTVSEAASTKEDNDVLEQNKFLECSKTQTGGLISEAERSETDFNHVCFVDLCVSGNEKLLVSDTTISEGNPSTGTKDLTDEEILTHLEGINDECMVEAPSHLILPEFTSQQSSSESHLNYVASPSEKKYCLHYDQENSSTRLCNHLNSQTDTVDSSYGEKDIKVLTLQTGRYEEKVSVHMHQMERDGESVVFVDDTHYCNTLREQYNQTELNSEKEDYYNDKLPVLSGLQMTTSAESELPEMIHHEMKVDTTSDLNNLEGKITENVSAHQKKDAVQDAEASPSGGLIKVGDTTLASHQDTDSCSLRVKSKKEENESYLKRGESAPGTKKYVKLQHFPDTVTEDSAEDKQAQCELPSGGIAMGQHKYLSISEPKTSYKIDHSKDVKIQDDRCNTSRKTNAESSRHTPNKCVHQRQEENSTKVYFEQVSQGAGLENEHLGQLELFNEDFNLRISDSEIETQENEETKQENKSSADVFLNIFLHTRETPKGVGSFSDKDTCVQMKTSEQGCMLNTGFEGKMLTENASCLAQGKSVLEATEMINRSEEKERIMPVPVAIPEERGLLFVENIEQSESEIKNNYNEQISTDNKADFEYSMGRGLYVGQETNPSNTEIHTAFSATKDILDSQDKWKENGQTVTKLGPLKRPYLDVGSNTAGCDSEQRSNKRPRSSSLHAKGESVAETMGTNNLILVTIYSELKESNAKLITRLVQQFFKEYKNVHDPQVYIKARVRNVEEEVAQLVRGFFKNFNSECFNDKGATFDNHNAISQKTDGNHAGIPMLTECKAKEDYDEKSVTVDLEGNCLMLPDCTHQQKEDVVSTCSQQPEEIASPATLCEDLKWVLADDNNSLLDENGKNAEILQVKDVLVCVDDTHGSRLSDDLEPLESKNLDFPSKVVDIGFRSFDDQELNLSQEIKSGFCNETSLISPKEFMSSDCNKSSDKVGARNFMVRRAESLNMVTPDFLEDAGSSGTKTVTFDSCSSCSNGTDSVPALPSKSNAELAKNSNSMLTFNLESADLDLVRDPFDGTNHLKSSSGEQNWIGSFDSEEWGKIHICSRKDELNSENLRFSIGEKENTSKYIDNEMRISTDENDFVPSDSIQNVNMEHSGEGMEDASFRIREQSCSSSMLPLEPQSYSDKYNITGENEGSILLQSTGKTGGLCDLENESEEAEMLQSAERTDDCNGKSCLDPTVEENKSFETEQSSEGTDNYELAKENKDFKMQSTKEMDESTGKFCLDDVEENNDLETKQSTEEIMQFSSQTDNSNWQSCWDFIDKENKDLEIQQSTEGIHRLDFAKEKNNSEIMSTAEGLDDNNENSHFDGSDLTKKNRETVLVTEKTNVSIWHSHSNAVNDGALVEERAASETTGDKSVNFLLDISDLTEERKNLQMLQSEGNVDNRLPLSDFSDFKKGSEVREIVQSAEEADNHNVLSLPDNPDLAKEKKVLEKGQSAEGAENSNTHSHLDFNDVTNSRVMILTIEKTHASTLLSKSDFSDLSSEREDSQRILCPEGTGERSVCSHLDLNVLNKENKDLEIDFPTVVCCDSGAQSAPDSNNFVEKNLETEQSTGKINELANLCFNGSANKSEETVQCTERTDNFSHLDYCKTTKFTKENDIKIMLPTERADNRTTQSLVALKNITEGNENSELGQSAEGKDDSFVLPCLDLYDLDSDSEVEVAESIEEDGSNVLSCSDLDLEKKREETPPADGIGDTGLQSCLDLSDPAKKNKDSESIHLVEKTVAANTQFHSDLSDIEKAVEAFEVNSSRVEVADAKKQSHSFTGMLPKLTWSEGVEAGTGERRCKEFKSDATLVPCTDVVSRSFDLGQVNEIKTDKGLKTDEKYNEGYLDSTTSATAVKDKNTPSETHFEKNPAAHLICDPELPGVSKAFLTGSILEEERSERWMREGRGEREHATHMGERGNHCCPFTKIKEIGGEAVETRVPPWTPAGSERVTTRNEAPEKPSDSGSSRKGSEAVEASRKRKRRTFWKDVNYISRPETPDVIIISSDSEVEDDSLSSKMCLPDAKSILCCAASSRYLAVKEGNRQVSCETGECSLSGKRQKTSHSSAAGHTWKKSSDSSQPLLATDMISHRQPKGNLVIVVESSDDDINVKQEDSDHDDGNCGGSSGYRRRGRGWHCSTDSPASSRERNVDQERPSGLQKGMSQDGGQNIHSERQTNLDLDNCNKSVSGLPDTNHSASQMPVFDNMTDHFNKCSEYNTPPFANHNSAGVTQTEVGVGSAPSPAPSEYPTALSPVIERLHPVSQHKIASTVTTDFQKINTGVQNTHSNASLMELMNYKLPNRVLLPCTFDDDNELDNFNIPGLDIEKVFSSDEENSDAQQQSPDGGDDTHFREGAMPQRAPQDQDPEKVLTRKDEGSAEGSGMETLLSCSTIVAPLKTWAFSEEDIEHQLEECRSVLQEVSRMLSNIPAQSNPNKVNWNSQLSNLEQQALQSQTSIAVVGDTGAGKSSLLNALLEEEAVLPTSAMRACTSVVVQVSQNSENEHYEADVEFFTEEEWDKELETLITDMKDKSGHFKKRRPDPKTEAGVAYSRVKAVYGKIAEFHELKQIQEVTCYLGMVKHISKKQVTVFRAEIEKFIDSRMEDLRNRRGGELWPIVKCIRIRVPNSEVLKTGVVLVDLPGIRDSNSARNNIAKQHLKTCDAVWIVANITRAVDDKTAKDMLNENMRRQLLMDGHYERIAFICTKTDSYNISEISRALALREEIQPLEEEIMELEKQLTQATTDKEKSHLERQTQEKLRAIALTCVKARNAYSKKQIRTDFTEGLKEMKRKVAAIKHEGDEEDEDDEDISDEEEVSPSSEPQGNGDNHPYQDGALQVFTVSSTEFLKLKGKLSRDGPPVVFNTEEDTEIPALKSFAQQTALKKRTLAAEKLIRSVASFVSQVVTYLTNQRAQDESQEAQVQEMVQCCITGLQKTLQQAAEECNQEIEKYFCILIKTHLNMGVKRAINTCEEKVRRWGCSVSDPFKTVGGFPYATYKATCARQGVFTSPSFGQINFNEELSEPLCTAISVSWDKVFNHLLLDSLNKFKKSVLQKLKEFFREVKDKLRSMNVSTAAVVNVQNQQLEAADAELQNFILDLKERITERQRDISRVLTPTVQEGMIPAYQACGQQAGAGCFQRMKSLMQEYVHRRKSDIFNTASERLMEQLDLLQKELHGQLEVAVENLCETLRVQFEPVLKPVKKNDGLIPDLTNIWRKVSEICCSSGIDFSLPNLEHMERSSPLETTMPKKEENLELDETATFTGKCMSVRVRDDVPFALASSIRVTVNEILLTHTDAAPVNPLSIPLNRVQHCEFCHHMCYFILHISPERTWELHSALWINWSSTDMKILEMLVMLEKSQDLVPLQRILNCFSQKHRAAVGWLRELKLEEGIKRLESLGVLCKRTDNKPVFSDSQSFPSLCQNISLLPFSRKRSLDPGEAAAEQQQQKVRVTLQKPQAPFLSQPLLAEHPDQPRMAPLVTRDTFWESSSRQQESSHVKLEPVRSQRSWSPAEQAGLMSLGAAPLIKRENENERGGFGGTDKTGPAASIVGGLGQPRVPGGSSNPGK